MKAHYKCSNHVWVTSKLVNAQSILHTTWGVGACCHQGLAQFRDDEVGHRFFKI